MNGTMRIVDRIVLVSISVALFLSGCSPTQPTSDYGASEGATSRSSPDGFSVVRQLCVEAGYAATSIRSLPSNGERKLSTLVWAPHGFQSHNAETMDWVERWLRSGNKTLVYVGSDYSPNADYWEATSKLSQSESEVRDANINAAVEKSALLSRLVSGYSVFAFPWGLYKKKFGEHQSFQALEGEWSREIEASDINLKLRSHFQVWNEVSDNEIDLLLQANATSVNSATTPASKSSTTSSPPTPQPNGPAGMLLTWLKPESWGEEYVLQEKARRDAIKAELQDASAEASRDSDFWSIFEDMVPEDPELNGSDAEVERKSEEIATNEIVLSGPNQLPLVTIISKPSWNGSRIVLFANASLISNLSLTYSGNRLIISRLISTFSPGRVGFLSQPQDPIVLDGENGSTGLASLLNKPVNLLAAHLVFLGLVALLYLWPIFGRPAELPAPSTQSFSLHINALGSLLQKTGDDFYARTTIADYFKQVKKDHNSVWANLDAEFAPTTESPFRQDDVNSATTNSND